MHTHSFSNADGASDGLRRLGHHAPRILIGAIAVMVIMRLHPPPLQLQMVASVALVVVVLGSWLTLRRHDTGLCESCVSAMPLNPAERAERYAARFEVAHLGSDRRYVLGYLAVLLGANFLPGRVGLLIWALVQLSMVYLILAYSTHRTLQPWCPQCQGGGGQDRDQPDVPTPTPENHLA